MRPKSCPPCGSLSSSKLSNARILARIKRPESEGRDSKPAVTTTVPPTNERRKASLSARIRSRESAFSAVIFKLKEFVQRESTHAPVVDPRSRISRRSCSTRLLWRLGVDRPASTHWRSSTTLQYHIYTSMSSGLSMLSSHPDSFVLERFFA